MDSLGAYIISMARTASDVLAVVLLQRECGIKETLRVVSGAGWGPRCVVQHRPVLP